MVASLMALLFVADSVGVRPDTVPTQVVDTMKVDTLQEVIVHSDQLPVSHALKKSMGKQGLTKVRQKSLGDLLEKLSPGINDKITHPFAFKQRKMERKQKRTRKILEHYDQVKTFEDLLREAIDRENQAQQAAGEQK